MVALAALADCHGDPKALRTVTLHAPATCAARAPALDGRGYVEYTSLGDFEPSAPVGGHVIGDDGAALSEIDGAARALLAEATEGDRQWLGVGDVPASGNVDVLLLPALQSCALSTPVGPRAGAVLASLTGRRALVAGGSASTSPRTYIAHLDTGSVAAVSPDMLTPRTRASVTAFGDGALVAGGVDPRVGGAVLGTAEVFDTALGGFDQQHPILLSAARADAGAVVLATGETLLVGGVGADGVTVLGSMEIVDPVTRTVRAENVARLAVARRSATVLRLASGEILVFGGLDGGGAPVQAIEWFSADASQTTKRPRDLVSGAARDCVALEAGGALAVIAPPVGAPANFQNTWVIGADGSLDPATPIAGALTRPVLFGGAGGAPALWTGDRWLRWQPWVGAFASLGALDDVPVAVGDGAVSADPGTAMWIDPSSQRMTVLRFDVRGEYSALAGPLLVADAAETAPDELTALGGASFDPAVGLTLGPGASAFVTDRTYAGVSIDVDFPTGEPALVVLRDEFGHETEIGGNSCPTAPVSSVARRPFSLHVQRTGATIAWSFAGADAGAVASAGVCPTGVLEDARESIGLRGVASAARSVAGNLRVVRVREP